MFLHIMAAMCHVYLTSRDVIVSLVPREGLGKVVVCGFYFYLMHFMCLTFYPFPFLTVVALLGTGGEQKRRAPSLLSY